MNETDWIIVLVAGLVVFFLYEKTKTQQPPLALGASPAPGYASGSPQDGHALEHAIGAAAGVGICEGVASYEGDAAIGRKLAPACAAIGSFVAPYAKKAVVFAAKETAAGAVVVAKGTATAAVAVAHTVASGAKLATHAGVTLLEQPFATPLSAASKTTGFIAGAAGNVDRGVDAVYKKLPAPLMIVGAAPVVAEKITVKAVEAAATVASKATGALASGAKSATKAVSSGVHKVLGWL